MLATIWSAFLWPFRTLGKGLERVGHLATALLGFILMVLGIGALAATYYLVGIMVFAVGLFLLSRSLR